ncbi:hypothetical protein [Candidatus Nitrosocosmicus sp. SS]|uniref:hypothetical protein n=1 Tax=Candidatus Nitrosocosmicus agrestis TaxID=2563600 RepID=UPI00122E4F0D|nr:hypothetical protein [Candidatus Nitrosocosmicus sp. SS]KAA2281119.1 hypothetical protein F1Z66_09350 [Candidatus Nitrosocosmicus sp. SS]KAF0869419.1 hypothetical protein E5N71_05090 [Candidatus Nitrosocosmicus sp. SS]
MLLSVMFIPISQVAYGQNIIDQIGQAFNNLTSSMSGGNQTNQSSTNGSSGAGSGGNSSGGSDNQSAQDVGSIQELQNLTSGNQELLTNNSDISPDNASLSQGLEKEQYVEPENQSNALSSSSGSNSTQQ